MKLFTKITYQERMVANVAFNNARDENYMIYYFQSFSRFLFNSPHQNICNSFLFLLHSEVFFEMRDVHYKEIIKLFEGVKIR